MMASRLSIAKRAGLAFLIAFPAFSAELGAALLRQPGSALDTSLKNEVAHAADHAASWLAERQNPDGSWGSETGRVLRTSVALLALTTRGSQHSDAVTRAAVWLDRHAPDEAEISDLLWRAIALLTAVSDVPARSNLTGRLLREALPHRPAANEPFRIAHLLWNDFLTLCGEPEPPVPPAQAEAWLQRQARTWPSFDTSPFCLWPAVHGINRLGKGALERDGQPLDWRSDVAQTLISTQRRDALGGYWGALEGDVRILNTAFGLIVLQEL